MNLGSTLTPLITSLEPHLVGCLNVIFIPQHNDNGLLSMTYNSILIENNSFVSNVSMGTYFRSLILSVLTGAVGGDFTDDCMNINVPAATTPGSQTFELPEFYSIVNDEINEVKQSFVLVAEIGPDITATCDVDGIITECSCFQTADGETECFGRSGATEIRITDNDSE